MYLKTKKKYLNGVILRKIFFLHGLFIFSFCQSQICNCEAFIDWESDIIVEVYNDPFGQQKIAELQNDRENENFLLLTIVDSDKDFFKVYIGLAMEDNQILGWIRKTKEIATYSSNYSENTLNFYFKPNRNSKIKTSITEYYSELLSIVDCKKKWVYVNSKKDSVLFEGWVEPNLQCSNPYTNCN